LAPFLAFDDQLLKNDDCVTVLKTLFRPSFLIIRSNQEAFNSKSRSAVSAAMKNGLHDDDFF
jgi:hypothetical protein